jgi:hypothetical protein
MLSITLGGLRLLGAKSHQQESIYDLPSPFENI